MNVGHCRNVVMNDRKAGQIDELLPSGLFELVGELNYAKKPLIETAG